MTPSQPPHESNVPDMFDTYPGEYNPVSISRDGGMMEQQTIEDKIYEILYKHEGYLSDGYEFYGGDSEVAQISKEIAALIPPNSTSASASPCLCCQSILKSSPEVIQAMKEHHAAIAKAERERARKELLKDLQLFIDNADSHIGCPNGTLGTAYLVQWMGGQGWDCD